MGVPLCTIAYASGIMVAYVRQRTQAASPIADGECVRTAAEAASASAPERTIRRRGLPWRFGRFDAGSLGAASLIPRIRRRGAPRAYQIPGLTAELLGRCTPLKVEQAEAGDRLRPEAVFVAPPGRHYWWGLAAPSLSPGRSR